MDYTVIGDSVNIVFRLQALAKTSATGILISDSTLRALRTRPQVRVVTPPGDAAAELGELKVYELIAAGKPPVGAAESASDAPQSAVVAPAPN
jgi:class 3 adenylate cyclase